MTDEQMKECEEVWEDCEIHPDVECYKTVCTTCGEVMYRDCETEAEQGEKFKEMARKLAELWKA